MVWFPPTESASSLHDRGFIRLPRLPSLPPCAHVVGACPQPSGPRPRITPGAVTPPGAHGAWKSTGAATQALPPASSPRLRKPASRSCSAGTGSATGGRACVACWRRCRLCAMRPRRRAIPARAPCGGAGRWAATLSRVAAHGVSDGWQAGQTEIFFRHCPSLRRAIGCLITASLIIGFAILGLLRTICFGRYTC